jgi:predicted NodU family carbamoyl transferase
MNILGVCTSKDASACFLIDVNLTSAVGEERFNRLKLTREFTWRITAGTLVSPRITHADSRLDRVT